ncbi:helix-turn-helix transcriptional regulator [Citrobacter amalonaticus]|nr:helix-turn-helix transcriptional regulator [Citrobacter amalonaticus]
MLKLTKKETQICNLIFSGLTNKEISNMTHRSIHTVNTHVRNIYRNNHLQGRIDLCKTMLIEGVKNEKGQE